MPVILSVAQSLICSSINATTAFPSAQIESIKSGWKINSIFFSYNHTCFQLKHIVLFRSINCTPLTTEIAHIIALSTQPAIGPVTVAALDAAMSLIYIARLFDLTHFIPR